MAQETVTKFDKSYAAYAKRTGKNYNPDDPRHYYDYRKLYAETGKIQEDKSGHLPSKYKTEGHPRMVVDNINTKTGNLATKNTITTEELRAKIGKDSYSTEELFGKTLPALKDPSLPEYLKYKVTMDKANASRSRYGAEAMWGRMDTQKALKKGNAERDYWTKEAGPYADVKFTENPIKYVAGEAAGLIPYMVSSQVQGLKYGLTMGGGFALIAAKVGQIPPFTLMAEEFMTVPAAFGVGMTGGYSFAVITHILDREGGSLYLDMVENGISEDTSRMVALTVGTVIGITELSQFSVVGKFYKKAFSKLIRTKTGKNAIRSALGRYAKTVGINVAQEDLQEITSLAGETIASMIDDKPDAKPTREEWVKRVVETTQRSVAGLAVISAPGAVIDVAISGKQADAVKLQEMITEEPTIPETFAKEPAPIPVEGKKAQPTASVAPKPPTVEPLAKPVEQKAKKPTTVEALEKHLAELQASEETAKDKRQVIKNEIQAIKSTIEAIQETPEYSVYGEHIFKDKKAVLKDLQSQVKFQQERLSKFKPDVVSRREPTIIKQRLTDIKRGIREGIGYTQKQVKAIQNEMIEMISILEAKDKAKFIKTIKNIQTPAQLDKAVNNLIVRIVRVQEQTKKATIGVTIKKELTKTKPVRKGQRVVGRYDYESNKFFEEVRGYSKLNQAKAQELLDALPEEVADELDLIKRRMLSLKANGATASLAIYEQVLKDIKTLKELGAAAKDDANFEKAINRQERVDKTLAGIDKSKANKKSIKTKIGNAYRRGFANMYSMFNAVAGMSFAKEYNPEVAENARDTAVSQKTAEIAEKATKIYEQKNVMKIFESMSTKDYTITDIIDGLTIELSKLELIDIYNSIKNDKKQQDYFEAYGEDQIKTLLGNLTSKDEAFADMLQESIQEYFEILNARNIETTGRDLGIVENYWPATSEFTVSVIDDMRVQGETPSAMKERAKGRVIPKPKNAWFKAGKHISQAEHVKHLSREYETLKRLFNDRKVKHAIEQKFGEHVYQTILAQIENISLNKQTQRIDAISGVFQKAINNWVTAKIALNPSTYVRQLMSMSNFMENMPVAVWTKGFFEAIAHPRQTWDFMWNNAPFLEARFKRGSTEAMNEAIRGAESIGVNKANYVKALTALVRSGDITAIIYGGKPYVDYLMSKEGGNKTLQEAMKMFEQATLRAQQSGLASSRSQFQNSKGGFTRLFLAFKNTTNQYMRKQVDAIISYQNKDISVAQLAKTTVIYSIIQPIAYVSAGFATREAFGALGSAIFGGGEEKDLEDRLERYLYDIMTQLVVSPVNSIPLLNDLVKAAMRKATGQPIYKILSIPWLDDIETAMRKFTKKEVTFADYLEIAGSVLEPTTAIPAGTAMRYYKLLTGSKIGETKQSGYK